MLFVRDANQNVPIITEFVMSVPTATMNGQILLIEDIEIDKGQFSIG